MPYEINKVKTGYKVCKKDNPKECFSKKGLTKNKAIKQMKAIIISENKKVKSGSGKTLKAPFGRMGGKSKLKKIIINEYFPKNYENMTYVEPFVGAGNIYFYKMI